MSGDLLRFSGGAFDRETSPEDLPESAPRSTWSVSVSPHLSADSLSVAEWGIPYPSVSSGDER